MSIFAWIILGLIAGFIAGKIVNKAGEGFVGLRSRRKRVSSSKGGRFDSSDQTKAA